MATGTGTQESLERHLAWLYPDPSKPCLCDSGWVSYGTLHGVNMGKGWARTSTHPDCYHHGTKAQETYKRTGQWPHPGKGW